MIIENKDKDKVIIIESTEDSPEITLDLKNCKLIFNGSSFPEDAVDFYSPILKWIIDNKLNFTKEIICSFDFTILSSASNKMIFEILLKLEDFYKTGKKILIKWYYSSFDEDMFDEGKGFKDSMKIPFEIIEKQTL